MASIETLTSGEIRPKAIEAPGPVALDFYQESCPPCRLLGPRLERVAAKYGSRLSVYRVDVDRDLAVAEGHGVMSLPTVLVLRDGKVIEHLDGRIREADLVAAFDRATDT